MVRGASMVQILWFIEFFMYSRILHRSVGNFRLKIFPIVNENSM